MKTYIGRIKRAKRTFTQLIAKYIGEIRRELET
jgi:hypothetical protein